MADMITMGQYFMGQADQAFARKKDLYNQILQSILSQELKTPGQRRAELELLAREETTLRTLEDGLRKAQREAVKSDATLINTLSKGQTSIAQANIDYNRAVAAAKIMSATELAVEKSKAERQIDEDASRERARAGELAASAKTQAGSFPNASFTSTVEADVEATAAGQGKALWDASFKSKMSAATTPAERQAVTDAYKTSLSEWMSRQSGPAHYVLQDPGTQSKVLQQVFKDYGVTDSGMTSEQMIAADAAKRKAGVSIPQGVGQASLRPVDQDIIVNRKEKIKALLGFEPSEVDVSVNLDSVDTQWEKYLATATFNRMNLAEPEVAAAFFSKYPTTDKFIAALNDPKNTDTDMPHYKLLVQESELLDPTTLKELYSGEIAQGFRNLRERQAALDERKRTLADGVDGASAYEDAVNKARVIFRRVYGGAGLQSGMAAAEAIRTDLKDASPEEQQAILDQMPITDRQKQIFQKAARGEPITDREFVILNQQGAPTASLSNSVFEKLNTKFPGIVDEQNRIVVSYDAKGTPIYKDIESADIGDLTDALASYKGDGKGQGVLDEDTKAKLRESSLLIKKLAGAQPGALPVLHELTSKQLESWLDGMTQGTGDTRADGTPPLQDKPTPATDAELQDFEFIPPAPGDITQARARDMQLLTPDFKQVGAARLKATQTAAPEVMVAASSRIKEQRGRAPNPKELIGGIEQQLASFGKQEKQLLTDLARQSRGSTNKEIQANVGRIINPAIDPDKYQTALAYIGMASNDDVIDVYKTRDAEKVRRDLKLLIS